MSSPGSRGAERQPEANAITALAWTGLDPGTSPTNSSRQPDLGLVARRRTVGADHAGVGQQAEIAGGGPAPDSRERALHSAALPHMAAREPSEFQ